MKPFRLQRVLEERQRKEDALKLRMAAATAARVQAEAALQLLIETEQARRHGLAALLAGGRVAADRAQDALLGLEAIAFAISGQREEVARRIAFESTERALLNTAMAERKALDRLRERHEQRERQEERHREAMLLEEIVAARTARDRMAAARAGV